MDYAKDAKGIVPLRNLQSQSDLAAAIPGFYKMSYSFCGMELGRQTVVSCDDVGLLAIAR